jgi:AcrR family transcriptional regulator
MNLSEIPSRSDLTRAALVRTALSLFGQHGFEATSTRAIAAGADANVAAIAYHFGGKDGLRRACAEHCAATILTRVRSALPEDLPGSPDAAREMLRRIAQTMIGFLLSAPEAAPVSAFLLREMAEDGPGVDVVYAGLIGPVHASLCQLWATATGSDAQAPATRIAVFAFIGQIVYFRVGRPVVLRRMGWSALGPPEAAQIADVVLGNLDALLSAGSRA